MKNFIDITGQTFGYLKIIKISHIIKSIKYWECLCKCGKIIKTRESSLKNGDTKSCGCYSIEQRSKRFSIHNLSKSPEYSIYYGILDRCNNKNCTEYKNYGGRGITVCEELQKILAA